MSTPESPAEVAPHGSSSDACPTAEAPRGRAHASDHILAEKIKAQYGQETPTVARVVSDLHCGWQQALRVLNARAAETIVPVLDRKDDAAGAGPMPPLIEGKESDGDGGGHERDGDDIPHPCAPPRGEDALRAAVEAQGATRSSVAEQASDRQYPEPAAGPAMNAASISTTGSCTHPVHGDEDANDETSTSSDAPHDTKEANARPGGDHRHHGAQGQDAGVLPRAETRAARGANRPTTKRRRRKKAGGTGKVLAEQVELFPDRWSPQEVSS
jgi:hypothetical protein